MWRSVRLKDALDHDIGGHRRDAHHITALRGVHHLTAAQGDLHVLGAAAAEPGEHEVARLSIGWVDRVPSLIWS